MNRKFPKLAPGQQWHPLHGQTPESLGVAEGWRPLLVGEKIESGDEFYFFYLLEWRKSFKIESSPNRRICYRTKRPMPGDGK